MKKLLTLLCCVSMVAYADVNDGTNVNTLVVWAKDGTNVAYALEKLPQLEFGETTLSLTCGTEQVTYLFDNTDRITYTAVDYSGINSVKLEDKRLFVVGEQGIEFSIALEDRKVSLYDEGGKQCLSLVVRKGDTYTLPLSNLSTGIYIIKVNSSTCKIVKR